MSMNMKNKIAVSLVVFAIMVGVSWIITCGIIKLITICFGVKFKWRVATGIWLIMCLLKGICNKRKNV